MSTLTMPALVVRRVAAFALALLSGACVAQAAAPIEPPVGRYLRQFSAKVDSADADISFTVLSHIRVSTLVGEPVVFCVAKWNLDSVRLPLRTPDGRLLTKVFTAREVPEAVWRQADLSVTLSFPVATPAGQRAGTAAVDCDPGVLAAPGAGASFNVPGSPAWGRLFYYLTLEQRQAQCNGVGREPRCAEDWLNADEAKSVVKAGIQFAGDLVRPPASASVKSSGPLNDPQRFYPTRLSVNVGAIRAWAEEQELNAFRAVQVQKAERARATRPAAGTSASADPLEAAFDKVAQADADKSDAGYADRIERLKRDGATALEAQRIRLSQLKANPCAPKTSADSLETQLTDGTAQMAACRSNNQHDIVGYCYARIEKTLFSGGRTETTTYLHSRMFGIASTARDASRNPITRWELPIQFEKHIRRQLAGSRGTEVSASCRHWERDPQRPNTVESMRAHKNRDFDEGKMTIIKAPTGTGTWGYEKADVETLMVRDLGPSASELGHAITWFD